jgi:hypothetical protein
VEGGDYTGTIELRPRAGDGAAAAARYFYCEHRRSLEVLNKDSSHIAAMKPVRLERVVPAPEPHFLVTDADSGSTIHARVGDRFAVALPVASLAASRTAWAMKPPAAECMTVYAVTGSGSQGVFTSNFELKAAAPGRVRLEFESAGQTPRTVAYEFEVLP